MVHSASIAKDVNPQIARAAAELGILLDDYHYSPHARDRIVRYTIAHGTPTGCPELDREDESDASAVFESELEPIEFSSDAWDRDGGVYLDVPMLIDGTHPTPFGTEPAGPDSDRSIPTVGLVPPVLEDLAAALPPIAGGSEEAEPFEPGPDDLADYGRWSEALERRREMLSWYERNPIAAFNADRLD
jgi:hypothetical protein